jgi:hypothetical protein
MRAIPSLAKDGGHVPHSLQKLTIVGDRNMPTTIDSLSNNNVSLKVLSNGQNPGIKDSSLQLFQNYPLNL